MSRNHFIQHHTNGPNIGAMIDFLAIAMLGRHIEKRAHGRTIRGHAGFSNFMRQAEVEYLDSAICIDHDIFRLEITVHDIRLMRFLQAFADLDGYVEHATDRQRLVAGCIQNCA